MTSPSSPPAFEMPFLDHLEELRWRLVWSLGALVAGMLVAFALVSQVDVIKWLEGPVLPLLGGKKLVYTSPTDPFSIFLNASFALGVVLASPVMVYQLWAFLAPALYRHEKRVIIPVLAGGVVLFLAGASLAFFVVLPLTLQFLLGFQSSAIEPMLTVRGYFDFAIGMALAFGIVFELPIVIIALTALGVVTPAFLHKYRRHAVVLCFAGAAFVTPGADPTSLFALAVPLYFLFELSVVLSTILYKRRQRAERAAAVVPPSDPYDPPGAEPTPVFAPPVAPPVAPEYGPTVAAYASEVPEADHEGHVPAAPAGAGSGDDDAGGPTRLMDRSGIA